MEGSVAEALLDAARSGETETASRLLNANADPNSHEYVVGATPLETAALEGHEELVRLLLNHGADPNACDADGWTALHNAMLGASPNGLGVIRILCTRADVNRKTNADGHAPLHLAHMADPKLDWKLVNGADGQGRTAYFSPAVVQTLVAAGANVNVRAADGSTPLHAASAAGASSCVLALLHGGADVNAVDGSGRTALDLAGSDWHGGGRADFLARLQDMLRGAAAGGAPSLPQAEEVEEEVDDDVGGSSSGSGLLSIDGDDSSGWAAALEAVQLKVQRLRASAAGSSSAAACSSSPASSSHGVVTARPTYQPPPTAYPTRPIPPPLPDGYLETYGHLPASLEASPIHPPGGRQVYRATENASMGVGHEDDDDAVCAMEDDDEAPTTPQQKQYQQRQSNKRPYYTSTQQQQRKLAARQLSDGSSALTAYAHSALTFAEPDDDNDEGDWR